MVLRGREAWLPPVRCERRNRSPIAHFAVTGEALVAAKGATRRARRGVGGLVSLAVDVDERWRWASEARWVACGRATLGRVPQGLAPTSPTVGVGQRPSAGVGAS